MKNYHLVPDGKRWRLELEEDGSIQLFDNKERALKLCEEFFGNSSGSLKIHRNDGTIEEERTYPRDADPVESPG